MNFNETNTFIKGTITAFEDHSIPAGAASDSKNWLTKGDKIELRRGYKVLGTENSGTGSIDGLHVTFKANGTQILYRKRGRKLEYYNTATSDWSEVGSNLFPAAAETDEASFGNYASLAGNQMFICTPNSGPYKIMAANPGSYLDLTDTTKNFQGYIKIKQNRMFLWGRTKDKTGIYGSYIDAAAYTTVTAEATTSLTGTLKAKTPGVFTVTIASPAVFSLTAHGLIAGSSVQFSTTGALPTGLTAGTTYYVIAAGLTADAFEVSTTPGGSAVNTSGSQSGVHTVTEMTRTVFAVAITITGSGELYTDDYNGVLTGSLGGTGTINYTTGAYTLSNSGVGTATYQWENSNNTGITDFTKAATRLAGQGFIFRQDDGGGDVKNVASYGDAEFCLHRLKTWELTLTATDTNATNLIFRENVGIPNWRAAVPTGDGVYYIDDYDLTDPKFRLLTINNISTEVIPIPISDALNLKDYRFDKGVAEENGDLIVFECRHKDSPANDTTFVYDKRYKSFDRLDYAFSCAARYNGALVVGDSISDNVFEVFSGFDDNNSTIANHWEGNLTDLDIATLKKTRRLWVQGELSRDQTLNIYLSTDRGSYVLVGTQNGTDANVDSTPRTVIGSDAVGQATLGGQTSTNVYNYIKEIKLRNGKFKYVKIKFEATGLGYASISTYTFFDIISNQTKLPNKYRSRE